MKIVLNKLKHRISTTIEATTHRPNLVNIIQNTGWLFADKLLRIVLALIVMVWLARYLGPEQFGLLNFAMAFTALFGAIASFGLNSLIVRDLLKFPDSAAEILGTSAFLQMLGGLLSFAVITASVQFLRPDDHLSKVIIIILGLGMMFKFSETVKYWYESQVQSKYVVWAESGVLIVFALVKILLILNEASLLSFAWAILAESVVLTIALFALYFKQASNIHQWHIQFSRARMLIQESWPLILAGLSVMVYMRIDQVMLGQMLNEESVGIYSAAVRISEVWYFVPMAIVASVFPAIINAKQISESLYHQRLQKLYDLMVYLSVVVAIVMTFLSDWVVVTLFGQAYSEAGFVLAIHVWIGVFVALGVASGKWFVLENLSRLIFYRTLSGAVLNIILNLILIPSLGIIGCLIATLVSFSVAAFWFDALTKKTRKTFIMKCKALSFRGLYAN